MPWNQRYGHLYFKAVKLLYTKNMLQGLLAMSFADQVCEGFILESNIVSFPLGPPRRASTPLELIQLNLCGPIKIPCLNGSKYLFLIVDDYTRMSWVYFLKEKAKAFQKFVEFKALVENMSTDFIKTLRTDRGENLFQINLIHFSNIME